MEKEKPDEQIYKTPLEDHQAKKYDALGQAKVAMDAGDIIGMVTGILESYALDGLAQHLRKQERFKRLSFDDFDFIIGESVEALREYVSKGKKVHSILGFLWTVADRKAIDILRKRPPQFPVPPDKMEDYFAHVQAEEAERRKNRNKAFKVARSFIPELGGDTIQRVMLFILESIEGGFSDITSQEIGDALGLTATTVRKNRERGLKRLQRLFEEKGLSADAFRTEELE